MDNSTTMRGREQGLTFIGYVLILAIIGFFALIILKLTPVYLEYFRVKQQVESLMDMGGLEAKAAVQVKKLLLRRFSIDDITIPPGDIKLAKKGRVVKLQIAWVRSTSMVGNIDALATFEIKEEFTVK